MPPTRPVVGGHSGVNIHLSEIVSDVLDPVVGTYMGGMEIYLQGQRYSMRSQGDGLRSASRRG